MGDVATDLAHGGLEGEKQPNRRIYMSSRSILISGIGVARPTLAYWLSKCGFQATLVDRAPALRTGGYIIDFWGAGCDIAERMELLPDLRRQGYVAQGRRQTIVTESA